LSAHGNVTLCFDIFFVDSFAFVGMVSRNILFITVEHISSRAILKHVFPCLKRVNNLYNNPDFKITTMHANEEFPSLRHPLLELDKINLNIAATYKHVPEIERAIRTIKECNQSTDSGLPFKNYPKLLKLVFISQTVSWLNMLPHADGISSTMSPLTIITGTTANFTTHCHVPIGAYFEVHNGNDPSNTEKPRTSYAIALNLTGNLQGSFHFLSLPTGKHTSRR
jgi:hypothetical protein